jgi:hypothetical protein
MSQYNAEWHRFRLLTRLGVAAFLMILVSSAAAAWLSGYKWGQRVAFLLVVLCFFLGISLMVLGTIQGYFPCPRCKKLFSLPSSFLARPSMRRKCVHCGLRLYE